MKSAFIKCNEKFGILLFCFLFFLSFSSSYIFAQDSILPGKYKNYTLLHNGWKLTPAGNRSAQGRCLNISVTNNGRYAVTTNSGMGENSLSVIDLKNIKEVQRVILTNAWYGLVFNDNSSRLFVSGGNNNLIYIYNFNSGRLLLKDSIIIGEKFPKENISITGIDFVKGKNLLLAALKSQNLFMYMI